MNEAHGWFLKILANPSLLLDEMTTDQCVEWFNEGGIETLWIIYDKLIENESYAYAIACEKIIKQKEDEEGFTFIDFTFSPN